MTDALTAVDPPPKRWVIVGPGPDARAWARARGIGLAAVTHLNGIVTPELLLRTLHGPTTAVVLLIAARGRTANEVQHLLSRGARAVDPQWTPRPPGHEQAAEPSLWLRPGPGAA